jgi:hypothetical protein
MTTRTWTEGFHAAISRDENATLRMETKGEKEIQRSDKK